MTLRKVLGTGFGGAVGLVALWLVLGNAWAAQRERRIDAAWAVAPGKLPDFAATSPPWQVNETAKSVESAAGELGLDLVPRLSARQHPSGGRALGKDLRHELESYIAGELEKPDEGIGPPPPVLTSFLVAHAADLDLVVAGADASGGCAPADRCLASGRSIGGAEARVEVSAVKGETYYVIVDGAAGAASGYTLTLDCTLGDK